MTRESRKVWEKRIARLRASDLTDEEFADEVGVKLHRLQHWKWKLKREARDRADKKRTRRVQAVATAKSATFVQMQLSGDNEIVGARIELAMCGVTVRVPVGFDEATLVRVVSTLRRAS